MSKTSKLDLLISIYIFCICASELMGAKIIPLFSIGSINLSASVGIFTIPIIFTVNDVIVEVYGSQRARSIARSSLIVIFLLFLFAAFATNLPPAKRFQSSEAAYDLIFGQSLRISAASLISFTLAEFADIFVFVKIRKRLGKKALWFRNNVSNFISEFIDTALFMTLAFYTVGKPFTDNISFLTSIILPYWLLKCSMSVLETPFVYLGIRWLKSDKVFSLKPSFLQSK